MSILKNTCCMVEQKIKETTVQTSHTLHYELSHTDQSYSSANISYILLQGGFQMNKHGLFDVLFDLSSNIATHKTKTKKKKETNNERSMA